MQVLCLEDVLKTHCCLSKTSKTESNFPYSQRGVFEDLVRNTIISASLPQLSMVEEVSWCAGTGELLHSEK